jgi:hypothetical protein
MANKIIIGVVIGLAVGLVLGFSLSLVINLPSTINKGVGTNNQVQVSGTVDLTGLGNVNTLYFLDLNGTIETSAPIINGHYSVLLIGGQSYKVFDYSTAKITSYSDFNPFYVPLGVTTFTEDLVRP